jgi:hypothetical protein
MEGNLTLEKTRLSLVSKDNLKNVLTNFGLVIQGEQNHSKEMIFLSTESFVNDNPAKCSGCGVDMSTENFGHLAKGSMLIYCKNPKCFNHYLALKKIKEEVSNNTNV